MQFLGYNWAVFGISIIEKHFEIDYPIHGDDGWKKKAKKNTCWLFSGNERPLQAPEGPQWLALDNLE